MMDAGKRNKLIGSVMSAIIIILIFLILFQPLTAVEVLPGEPSDAAIDYDLKITFDNVNVTIRSDELIPVNHLNFTIYNQSNNLEVNYVKFDLNGTIIENPSGNFTVMNNTEYQSSWYNYGYMSGTDEEASSEHSFGYGYGYGYGGLDIYDILFSYTIKYRTSEIGTYYAKLYLNTGSYVYISGSTINYQVVYTPITNLEPTNRTTDVSRPPNNLSANIEGTNVDVYFYFLNMTPKIDTWTLFASWIGVTDQYIEFIDFVSMDNDWIWGKTIYQWKICINDSGIWDNRTYWYETDGSRYDVSNNDIINVQDLSFAWGNRHYLGDYYADYDGIYDVNDDLEVNVGDLSGIWANKT